MSSIQRVLAICGVILMTSVVLHADPSDKDDGKNDKSAKTKKTALSFTVKDIDGKDQDLKQYKGKVVMIVNVASQCGLTPQYAGLQQLHEQYKGRGF